MMRIVQSRVSVDPGAHSPSPPHAPHASQAQEELQTRERVPHLPHVVTSLVPAGQTPWLLQAEKGPQTAPPSVVWQLRVCFPQSGHGCSSICPTVQVGGMQAPKDQVQVGVQVASCVPPAPQGRVSFAPGGHAPFSTRQVGGSHTPWGLQTCKKIPQF
jgi:hypothetical protein